MKSIQKLLVISVATVLLANLAAFAAPFEAMFKIEKITGECMVCEPSGSDFKAAEEGKAYAYGTKMKTGRNSSAVIKLSEGNECRVLAQATLTITEDVQDKKLKSIKLSNGKVQVSLEEGFEKTDALNVETPTAICGAIACLFDVDASQEEQLDILASAFGCTEGQIHVFGPNFDMNLGKDNASDISCTRDGLATRIKDRRGIFQIRVRDADGNPKNIGMKPDMVVKIFRKKSPAERIIIVTILVTAPDGTLGESITYTEPLPPGGEPPPGVTPPTGTTQPGGETTTTTQEATTSTTAPDNGEFLTTTTSTTMSTTTTTMNRQDQNANQEPAGGGGTTGTTTPGAVPTTTAPIYYETPTTTSTSTTTTTEPSSPSEPTTTQPSPTPVGNR